MALTEVAVATTKAGKKNFIFTDGVLKHSFEKRINARRGKVNGNVGCILHFFLSYRHGISGGVV